MWQEVHKRGRNRLARAAIRLACFGGRTAAVAVSPLGQAPRRNRTAFREAAQKHRQSPRSLKALAHPGPQALSANQPS